MYLRKQSVALALALIMPLAVAGRAIGTTAELQAKALIGSEYTGLGIESLQPSCKDAGGGPLFAGTDILQDWDIGNLYCQGRPVLALKKFLGRVGDLPRWRIVDAVVIPAYEPNGSPGGPGTLQIMGTGPCTLDGKRDEYILVLVREGRRQKRNGEREEVAYSWRFDIQHEKIVPISTKRVRCVHDEP